jgi:hypothetical protein
MSNGFFAFESALYVLPAAPAPEGARTVQLRNDPDLWRAAYGSMTDGLFFFAEDAFGGQFALRDGGVVTFDPETGNIGEMASNLEGWADQLLRDYEMLTGFPLAHAWQSVCKNGGSFLLSIWRPERRANGRTRSTNASATPAPRSPWDIYQHVTSSDHPGRIEARRLLPRW